MKACYCTSGPPPHGICGACGAAGQFYRGMEQQRAPGPVTVIQSPGVSEDRVRQIIREEIAALKVAQR